ncbi:hypothetical protein [Rhodohalobacter mucosus]|uniref:Lipoprotein n=1 Tax=Rhodohalobacter mucosus TaxID=2079485 RepID=A0A316TUY6_9BACT|nr:hypothetical protein [Rhodohalobacter mucosus]PWN07541.1 hypothetical protein DDZ15_04610 [Rhodohalobacter mucosus]
MNSHKLSFFTLLIFIAGLLQSCGVLNSDDGPPVNTEVGFEGIYVQGFEDSGFQSCEYEEPTWKPVFNEHSFNQLQEFWEKRDQNGGPQTRLRITGILSSKGTYRGIYVTYKREIQILDILEIEYTEDADC